MSGSDAVGPRELVEDCADGGVLVPRTALNALTKPWSRLAAQTRPERERPLDDAAPLVREYAARALDRIAAPFDLTGLVYTGSAPRARTGRGHTVTTRGA